MTDPHAEARDLFDRALAAHATRDTALSIDLARRAIALRPDFTAALEHLGTLLITRRHAYSEGIDVLTRATATSPDDPGLWYSLGWCCEFAAHELQRRPEPHSQFDPRALFERAADAFRRCLALSPEGKLKDDAEDLLDHIENKLRDT